MNAHNFFVKELSHRGLTLALAESMTCGLAAHKLAAYKGTSDVLMGCVVCYAPEVKNQLLRVPQSVIDKCTCESKEVTCLLARNLKKLIPADIHASVTGLASDGGSETKEKPVGTVFFCVRFKNKEFHERKVFRGTPLQIREKACDYLYKFILSSIRHEENG